MFNTDKLIKLKKYLLCSLMYKQKCVIVNKIDTLLSQKISKLKKHKQNTKTNLVCYNYSLFRGINLRRIAEQMGGSSGAEIKGTCTEAGEHTQNYEQTKQTNKQTNKRLYKNGYYFRDNVQENRVSLFIQTIEIFIFHLNQAIV